MMMILMMKMITIIIILTTTTTAIIITTTATTTTGKAIEMNRQRGRDVITRDKDNIIKYQPFSQPNKKENDPRTVLDWEEIDGGFGSSAYNKAITFDKLISRDDQIGPQGQRPAAAVQALNEMRNELIDEIGEIGGDGSGGDKIDLDVIQAYNVAKQVHVPVVNLDKMYQKNRISKSAPFQ